MMALVAISTLTSTRQRLEWLGQVILTTSEGEYGLVSPDFRAFLEIFSRHLLGGGFEVIEGRLEPTGKENGSSHRICM
jgi:hypothetical protein